MTLSHKLSMFAVAITLAALTVLLGPGDAQARIECGAILGPGGAYVLDRNLMCPQVDKPNTAPQDRIGVLKVIGGATLNLNGHTVTCDPDYTSPGARDSLGIVTRDSTVRNGTVRGCLFGIIPSGSLVKGMTLDANYRGVMMRDSEGGNGNLIIGNMATRNGGGFFMRKTHGNTVIDNVAQANGTGFSSDESDDTLIENVARGNVFGFVVQGPAVPGPAGRLTGNRAEENGTGFRISDGGETTGNIASKNTGSGFNVLGSREAMLGHMRDNVARANGGDGFELHLYDGRPPGTLSSNYAINNQGYGFHILSGSGPALGEPTVTITGNTAIRNGADDLADDTDCRFALWTDNRFGTAAQACIH